LVPPGARYGYEVMVRALRTGREIIEIKRWARTSAEKRGKGEALAGVEKSVVAREVSLDEAELEEPTGEREKTSTTNAPSDGLPERECS
jgi:hypothetical protein